MTTKFTMPRPNLSGMGIMSSGSSDIWIALQRLQFRRSLLFAGASVALVIATWVIGLPWLLLRPMRGGNGLGLVRGP